MSSVKIRKKKIKAFFILVRPVQWYKNLVVFLALIFSGNLFSTHAILSSLAAFAAFVFASSSNYVINDIFDRKSDSLDIIKKHRPIASGIIKVNEAAVFSVILIVISLMISYFVSIRFMYIVFVFFCITLLYSLKLKDIPFVDIFMIAVNFVIRAVAGAVALSVYVSPWLVLCPFFAALLLASGKRLGELCSSRSALIQRPALKHYTVTNTKIMMIILSVLLILSYLAFSFLSIQKDYIVFTTVFVFLALIHYLFSAFNDYSIAISPHKLLKNNLFLLNILLYLISAVLVIYS